MDDKEFELLKAKFVKVFASIPLSLRKEITAVVNDKPINWEVAYLEINNNGENAKAILKQLKEIGVLK